MSFVRSAWWCSSWIVVLAGSGCPAVPPEVVDPDSGDATSSSGLDTGPEPTGAVDSSTGTSSPIDPGSSGGSESSSGSTGEPGSSSSSGGSESSSGSTGEAGTSSGSSGDTDASSGSTSEASTSTGSTGDTDASSGDTDASSGSEDTGTGTESGGSESSGGVDPPPPPVLALGVSAVKQFDFTWSAVADAESYELLESAALGEPFVAIESGILGESISLTMPLHLRHDASYVLRACNPGGCTDSAEVSVVGSLAEAVGYFKASNTGMFDGFGLGLAISADGSTLAIGAWGEDGSSSGINGAQGNDLANGAGAVYVFVRDAAGGWAQQAYIKASNPGESDRFGWALALSDDGTTLAVGTPAESSSATGIDGAQNNDGASSSGAVYVLTRDAMGQWSQQAYVKASNTGWNDWFGVSVALSADGDTLAVGAYLEDSFAFGVGGDQNNDFVENAGAAYVFERNALEQWSQQAYIKASNTGWGHSFGRSVALSSNGDTLAVGAYNEGSNATGIGGDEWNENAPYSGAVYVFERSAMSQWSQQAYVKASNTGAGDAFGYALALSSDGNVLAVGAGNEDSSATGIDGDQASQAAFDSGAAYVFERDGMGAWAQEAYVKASNTDAGDYFGESLALSGDGSVLVIGAHYEASNATGIEGDQANDSVAGAGAAYVTLRDGAGEWSTPAYVKAPNTDGGSDFFGFGVALDDEGLVLAVGAIEEDGAATGVGGNQADGTGLGSGAVYLY